MGATPHAASLVGLRSNRRRSSRPIVVGHRAVTKRLPRALVADE